MEATIDRVPALGEPYHLSSFTPRSDVCCSLYKPSQSKALWQLMRTCNFLFHLNPKVDCHASTSQNALPQRPMCYSFSFFKTFVFTFVTHALAISEESARGGNLGKPFWYTVVHGYHRKRGYDLRTTGSCRYNWRGKSLTLEALAFLVERR